jgi:uncharacterized protein YcaQ
VTGAPERISAAAARRAALAAQGFTERRPSNVTARHGRQLFDRIGLIQIDSVNVVVRSQELPVFARLGPHRRDLLTAMTARKDLFEYWAHEASLLPMDRYELFRWRMDEKHWVRTWTNRLLAERPGYIDDVLDEVRQRGPLSASELSDPGERQGPWWGWNYGKRSLELLFWQGRLAATRRPSFERQYDLVERVIPPEVLARPAVPETDARRELLALSAASLGVATAPDLCDYYRLKITKSRPLLRDLVDEGRLVPVRVEGWKDVAYAVPGVRIPRRVNAQALLSPFDSLVWDRQRTERVFGFRYRIEIYTPAQKRIHGYYVLPFLLDDRLVARVDVKADRAQGVLRVPAAHSEVDVDPLSIVGPLAAELGLMATWLGLGSVAAGALGDLTAPLAAEVVRTHA